MTTNDQNSLPSPADAQAVLDNLYQEAFFTKLAEFGHQPATQEDAIAMLETGYQLDLLPDNSKQQKQAGQYAAANGLLKQALAEGGVETGLAANTKQEAGIKQAAYTVANDPTYYGAVLALHMAQAAA